MNYVTDAETIVGIDEAGRGPLAGPVYVGIVVAPSGFDFSRFSHLTDSKQMKEADREDLYDYITEENIPKIEHTIRHTTAAVIDKKGINAAIQQAVNRGLRSLDLNPSKASIYLDGGLQASGKHDQQTITKGDEKEPIISLASVLAKVARDRKMRRFDSQYEFNFAQHKGYGTKAHRQKIEKNGPCNIHRKSFLKINGDK